MSINDSLGLFKSPKLEQVFIMSLFRLNPSPFTGDTNQMKVQAKLRGELLDQYTWDLRTLASSLSPQKNDGVYEISKDNYKWNPILVETFNYTQGTEQFSKITTFNPVSAFAKVKSENIKTAVQMTYLPIIKKLELADDYNDEFLSCINTLIECFILPGNPVLFTSTFMDKKSETIYGPQLTSKINISVSQSAPVTISFESTGSKTLSSKKKDAKKVSNSYRTLKYYDCSIDFKAHDSTKEFFKAIKNKDSVQAIKIVSMSLDVINLLDFKATGNYGTETIELGPRFALIKDRTVSGKITFIASSSNFIDINKDKGLTLYFGINLLFIMPNVIWQKPSIKISATSNELYIHEYSFLAFACDAARTNAYISISTGKLDISEFKLPSDNKELNLQKIMKEFKTDQNEKED